MSSTPGSAEARIFPARRWRPRHRLAPTRVHVRVLLHRGRLDRLLLEGAEPVTTAELTLRAYQLTRRPSRAALAASLEQSVASAARRRRRSATSAPLARDAIAGTRPVLAELARALREEPVAAARCVALVRRLLADGAGPLYVESGDGALREAAVEALRALGGPV